MPEIKYKKIKVNSILFTKKMKGTDSVSLEELIKLSSQVSEFPLKY